MARAQFAAAVEEPQRKHRKHYTELLRLDQGPIGQCTMVSGAHIVAAGPITQRPYYVNAPHFNTIEAYCRAQDLDKRNYGFTNPTYCQDRRAGDTGATMRSAAQVLREKGFIGHFWWLTTLEEVLAYLTNVGPVWFASWWWTGMNAPDANGFIHPTGRRRGGHAYVLDEIAWKGRYVWMLNSWGQWGHRGRAKITFQELSDLMADWGEAIAVTEVRKG
ncbi:MAG: hypothetical protein KY464_17395 [Gemmatimonadetes bacterium]|nr:hypothetical protein [Gemmatimonadota bacterium]